MKKQYVIEEKNKQKREKFYNYIINKYKLNISYPYKKELFINSIFPFVVDFKAKTFWICESITCLACTKIITVNEFKTLTK